MWVPSFFYLICGLHSLSWINCYFFLSKTFTGWSGIESALDAVLNHFPWKPYSLFPYRVNSVKYFKYESIDEIPGDWMKLLPRHKITDERSTFFDWMSWSIANSVSSILIGRWLNQSTSAFAYSSFAYARSVSATSGTFNHWPRISVLFRASFLKKTQKTH